MTNWDLATRENWELILSDQRTVVYKEGTQPTAIPYKYAPISPIYANPRSHVLLIGTYSKNARAHWFLGARASQYLYVSPSMNSSFLTSGVQASDTKKIGLNRFTLVEFKNYNIVPYVLQLDIPYWLEHIYVEVWEYQDDLVNDVDDRLFDIQATLDAMSADIESMKQRLNELNA